MEKKALEFNIKESAKSHSAKENMEVYTEFPSRPLSMCCLHLRKKPGLEFNAPQALTPNKRDLPTHPAEQPTQDQQPSPLLLSSLASRLLLF